MFLDPETVWRFFSGMYDVALIEIVVIRCYFYNNFILMIMILMNKVVRYILFICVVIRWQYMDTDRFISETYSE